MWEALLLLPVTSLKAVQTYSPVIFRVRGPIVRVEFSARVILPKVQL